MTTYDVESLFTNIPLNDAINICLCGHMMWSHYSPTSLLMKLLIMFMTTYDVESLFTNIPLNEAINICLWRHMMLSQYSPTSLLLMMTLININALMTTYDVESCYSPTSLLMKLLIFVYDDIWCWVNIHQHPS